MMDPVVDICLEDMKKFLRIGQYKHPHFWYVGSIPLFNQFLRKYYDSKTIMLSKLIVENSWPEALNQKSKIGLSVI